MNFPLSHGLCLAAACVLMAHSVSGAGSTSYQKPPQPVLDILHAPVTPDVVLSPTRDRLLLVQRERYPSIAELAQPMLGLAGIRLNPQNNGPQRTPQNISIIIQSIPSGTQIPIKLPDGSRFSTPIWSPDGKQVAFGMWHPNQIELWVVDVPNARARKLDGITLNAVYGSPIQWMPDSRTLLCRTVPTQRGPVPTPAAAPNGPNVQESYGKSSPVRTYQDLLKNSDDDALFDYYATSQLILADTVTNEKKNLGKPDIYASVDPAPGGHYFLLSILRKPFSRLLPASGFPNDIVIWDREGNMVQKVASLPSDEGVPIEGVQVGPRSCHWRPTSDATLYWVEALDDGNPKTKMAQRDRLLAWKAPFKESATEILRVEHRWRGITWGERDGLALYSDYDRDRRWQRTFLVKMDQPKTSSKLVWERSARDRYRDPGQPLMRMLPSGDRVLWQTGNFVYLDGSGASARGDYPFLDRFNLETFKTERLFQCDDSSYESVIALVDTPSESGARFITRHETPVNPPNYLLRTANGTAPLALTRFQDPVPQLRKITKKLVTYKRADGVPLSFTLYLPPDYKPGQRLPTLVWAYPLEFNDADTAGQVSGSTNRFTLIGGSSHLFLALQGYAVLDGATMPIVGSPETMNDTFIEQIVASAKAAIDKATELGVTDPAKVAVGGHSYGAFMTANLLAHSDLFRTGIARSGAYNRTLTPFGFQGERRTYWEAPEIYARLSPFTYAHKINEPILLIHGERDDNSGTFPIQSERLYQAVKGNGGNVRYVTLPFESHGYSARESIEHVLHEMIAWMDAHVKNSK